MDPQPRMSLVLSALLLLTATVVLFCAYNAKAQRNPTTIIAAQAKARILVTKTHLKLPVKIAVVKNQKGEMETDKEFVGDDDWLRGLTIRLTNNSGKAVTFVGIELVFWRTEDQSTGLPAAWPLRKGLDPFSSDSTPDQPEIASPNADLEIVLSDAQYDDIKRFLKDVEFPETIKKVEIQIVKIGFSDGTAWNGRMYRRDPKSLNGPTRGWTPVEKVGWERPKRNPQGGATNRTALFVYASGLTGTRKTVKASWMEPTPPVVDCGEVFLVGKGCGNAPPELNCFYESGR